jgi:hypothetical protein
MSRKLNSVIAVIGIDTDENAFHVVGLDARGAIVLGQKWRRGQVEMRLANAAISGCAKRPRHCQRCQNRARAIGR